MLNYMALYQNNKGFTLIEFLLYFTISSILLLSILSLFIYSNKALNATDITDEIFLNGRYGLEYIKEEVLSADKIATSNKFKNLDSRYPTNIGFVLMKENGDLYEYITYYQKNDELIRIACKYSSKSYPSQDYFKGFNQISTNLLSLKNTKIDKENKILNLHLDMGLDNKSKMEFKYTTFFRCIIDLD